LGFLADRLADAETAWSLGTFGAIAEFTRDADETATLARADGMISVVTARAVGLVDAHCPRRADAVAVQEDHDFPHRILLGPGGWSFHDLRRGASPAAP
jgi:hypothetical protein